MMTSSIGCWCPGSWHCIVILFLSSSNPRIPAEVTGKKYQITYIITKHTFTTKTLAFNQVIHDSMNTKKHAYVFAFWLVLVDKYPVIKFYTLALYKWSNPEKYGWRHHINPLGMSHLATTKHSKTKPHISWNTLPRHMLISSKTQVLNQVNHDNMLQN